MTHDTAPGPGDIARRRRLRADRARQVADVIRQQILRGAYDECPLPDERLLGQEFGASRNTVREALDLLRSDGLIERHQGIGTVVVARKYAHGLDRLMGLAETLHEHGTITNEVRTASPVSAPRVVASRLQLDEGATVVYIERLRWLNDLPLSLDLTYLPFDIGEPLLAEDLRNQDIFGLIERAHGRALGGADIGMEAVTADPHSAMILQVPRGSALLLVERLSHFTCGRPVDLEFIRFRGDRLTMRAHVSRSENSPVHRHRSTPMALAESRSDVPVTIDESQCITGCRLCVDICPLDSLAINEETGKAYMHVDECWYCGPCAARCPTGAVTVNMPYLLR